MTPRAVVRLDMRNLLQLRNYPADFLRFKSGQERFGLRLTFPLLPIHVLQRRVLIGLNPVILQIRTPSGLYWLSRVPND